MAPQLAHHRASRRLAALLAPACALVAALLALGGLLASTAGAEPRPDVPGGASITLGQTTIAPGGSMSFTGTGWTTTATTANGAVIGGVKLDDVDQLNTDAFTAAVDGTVSGRVTIPASTAPGEHWLRFLAGANQAGDPVRSLHVTFTVVALSTTSPSPSTTTAPPATGAGTIAAAPGADSGGTLPQTGPDITGSALIIGILVAAAAALGGAAVLRRHRRTA